MVSEGRYYSTWIAVHHEGTERHEYGSYAHGGIPLVLEDVETDLTLGIDVTVIDTGVEGDLEGLEEATAGIPWVD